MFSMCIQASRLTPLSAIDQVYNLSRSSLGLDGTAFPILLSSLSSKLQCLFCDSVLYTTNGEILSLFLTIAVEAFSCDLSFSQLLKYVL